MPAARSNWADNLDEVSRREREDPTFERLGDVRLNSSSSVRRRQPRRGTAYVMVPLRSESGAVGRRCTKIRVVPAAGRDVVLARHPPRHRRPLPRPPAAHPRSSAVYKTLPYPSGLRALTSSEVRTPGHRPVRHRCARCPRPASIIIRRPYAQTWSILPPPRHLAVPSRQPARSSPPHFAHN